MGDGPDTDGYISVAINEILDDRQKHYGDFEDQAEIVQSLKSAMRKSRNWEDELIDAQKEALEMIQHKIARILNGDPNYVDSWKDIAGYSLRVIEILEKK